MAEIIVDPTAKKIRKDVRAAMWGTYLDPNNWAAERYDTAIRDLLKEIESKTSGIRLIEEIKATSAGLLIVPETTLGDHADLAPGSKRTNTRRRAPAANRPAAAMSFFTSLPSR